jgi:hypothetical protein
MTPRWPALFVSGSSRMSSETWRPRLQQPHLLDADFTWLPQHRRMAENHAFPRRPRTSRLSSPTVSAAGRTLAELHSPFTDLLGLFPRSNVRVTDGLLYALHDQPNSNPAPIVITDAASVPMEVDCTFVAEGGTFHHLALDFSHQSAYLVLLLYKVQHTPKGVLTQMGLESAAPESYVLYFNLNSKYYDGAQNHGIHIPDSRLLEKPFRLTLRVERGLAEALAQWTLVVASGLPLCPRLHEACELLPHLLAHGHRSPAPRPPHASGGYCQSAGRSGPSRRPGALGRGSPPV